MNDSILLKLAADSGFNAAMEGLPRESNPWPVGSKEEAWWDLGWLEYFDSEETVDDERD